MVRIRLVFLLFLFVPITAGAEDHNPEEFLPLQIGNSWTFIHSYSNDSYSYYSAYNGTFYEDFDYREFEVPGFPHSEIDTKSFPPSLASKIRAGNQFTIEITHSEEIAGNTYYVFSDVSYDWPPLPIYFLAGKKVRYDESGHLVFFHSNQEILLYDFSRENSNTYIVREFIKEPLTIISSINHMVDSADLRFIAGFNL